MEINSEIVDFLLILSLFVSWFLFWSRFLNNLHSNKWSNKNHPIFIYENNNKFSNNMYDISPTNNFFCVLAIYFSFFILFYTIWIKLQNDFYKTKALLV